ncbi:MAG: response regulator transcription factor [Algicola sp.]|nr:response regulator transcription factor [Algicola sp.]
MSKTRILIADDHQIFRQGLRALLDSCDQCEIIDEVDNGDAAWAAIIRQQPDIAILDITMDKTSGLDVALKVQTHQLNTRIIFLSMHNEIKIIDRAMSAGACAYLLKDEAFDDLCKAVDLARKGKSYLSEEISIQLAEYQTFRTAAQLTKREKETVSHIARGHTNKEIAAILSLSVKTIDNHRTNLMKKLNLHNTAELVRYALLEGLGV